MHAVARGLTARVARAAPCVVGGQRLFATLLEAVRPRPAARGLATRAELAAARAAPRAPAGPAIAALFAQVERGLAPMAEANAGFTIAREGAAVLRVATARGDFVLTASEAEGTVTFSSPKVSQAGGAHVYRLAPTGHWAAVADGHLLLELLTRDLIHNVPGGLRGVPSF